MLCSNQPPSNVAAFVGIALLFEAKQAALARLSGDRKASQLTARAESRFTPRRVLKTRGIEIPLGSESRVCRRAQPGELVLYALWTCT